MADNDTTDIQPEPGTWRHEDTTYTVNPPRLRHMGRIMRFGKLFDRLQRGDEDIGDEQLDAAEAQLDDTIKELVPDFKGDVSQLPLAEKMNAVMVMGELATPTEAKMLDKMGVQPKGEKKTA